MNRSMMKKYILLFAAMVIIVTVNTLTAAAASYEINGVTLPLQENGYAEGDKKGAGLCWQFASHVYYTIWHRFFYLYAGDSDDLLREVPYGEERRITAENARLFISAAPVGSVIRLQEVIEGNDTTECSRHSLILLAKNSSGCVLYHDWGGIATVSDVTWQEFEDLFVHYIDFGYFKYIKYPGAEPLKYNELSVQDMEKKLLVHAKLQCTAELTVSKRQNS